MEIRYIRDYCAGSNVNGACVWLEIEAIRNGANVALNKEVTPSVAMTWGHNQVTDGSFNMEDYTWQMTYDSPQYVQIDLGQVYNDLEKIKIYHYPDGRIFNKLKTEVSSNGADWVTVFDSAISGTYAETIEGLSIDLSLPKVRYIKDSIQGANGNHWIEIEGYSNGANVALGKTVTHAGSPYSGSPSNVTDGDFSVLFETGNAPLSWVQIDLGAEIELHKIKVWHYFQDGRIYNGAKTEISADGVEWVTVFDSAVSGTYAESAEGHSIDLWGVAMPKNIITPQLNIKIGALDVDNIFLGEKQIINLYLGDKSLLGIPTKPIVNVTSLTNSVRLDWAITKNTTSWNIYRSTIEGTLGEKVTGGSFIKVNTFTDNSVIGGTTYFYTVEAKNADSNKAVKSNQVQAFPYSIQVYENKLVDFEGQTAWSLYDEAHVTTDFGNVASWQGGQRIKYDTSGRVRFELPIGQLGSANTGGVIKAKIAGKNEYTLDYEIRFDAGFPWSKGGKIPGLSGGAGYTGGEGDLAKLNGDGFSVRMMWREDGRIIPYVYHAGMNDKYGDTFGATVGYFTNTQAHKVKYYVKLNTIGENYDGILRIYLDDVLAYENNKICYRRNQCQVDTCHIAIFAGGSTTDWNMVDTGYIRLSHINWQ